VSVFQPIVNDLDQLWQQKVNQALAGLLFGAMCAVTFTLAENLFNATRVKWKSWALVIGTWLIVKVTFVSMMAQTGK
jgi:RsiW-degrading membrane proteinase PrsW (M82 family)